MLVNVCWSLGFIIIKQLGRHQATVSSLLLKHTTNTPKLVLSNMSFDLTVVVWFAMYISSVVVAVWTWLRLRVPDYASRTTSAWQYLSLTWA